MAWPRAAADAAAGAAAGGRPPKQDNDWPRIEAMRRALLQKEWGKMARKQRRKWMKQWRGVTLKSRVRRYIRICLTRTGAEPETTT